MVAVLSWVAASLGGAALACTLVGHFAVRRLLRGASPEARNMPPISVLKPLKGVDSGLYENLRALATQDYPCFELIFGTADPNDPALGVARRIQREFPQLSVTVVAGGQDLGANPKVSNLAYLSRFARYEHFLISDSNVRPGPDYLRRTAAELSGDNVGLVANLLVGVHGASPGAAMENMHLNSFVVSAVSSAEVVAAHPCVIGKSMLMHRDDLQALGGWQSVKDVLAEDYVLGQRFHRAGRRVVISPYLVPVIAGRRTVREFANRHLRWCQMRRWISPKAYLGEAFLNPIPMFLVASGASVKGDQLLLSALCLMGIAMKAANDSVLVRRLRGQALSRRELAYLPLKDVLVALLWFTAAVVRTIHWRGHRRRIGPGSVLTALPPPAYAEDVDCAHRTA